MGGVGGARLRFGLPSERAVVHLGREGREERGRKGEKGMRGDRREGIHCSPFG